MATAIRESDAVVVGAGSSGAAAAFLLARAGLRVSLVEARPLAKAGARWSDDLPPWLFDRAGIERPEPPERRNRDVPYSLLGRTRGRVDLAASPMWAVEIPRLTARLQASALDLGVAAFERAAIERLDCDARGRPVALRIRLREGRRSRTTELRARLFVDATGARAALLRLVPALERHCPPVRPDEACSAAQAVCDVSDRFGAIAFLERNNSRPGAFLAWTGVRGGFSTRIVHVDEDLESVSVLTGAAWDGFAKGARTMMEELRRELPWIGRVRLGGDGIIPLRRPYDRLAASGIALVGDAGCQVFPPTGCGVGSGLVAARLLADSVSRFDDPGAREATWAYQAAFQRERGGTHAAYDIFRRLAWRLSSGEVEKLTVAGLITAASLKSSLLQVMPRLGVQDLATTAAGSVRVPGLAARMAVAIPRMFAVHEAYRLYPATPDLGRLRTWSRAVSLLAGHLPDIAAT